MITFHDNVIFNLVVKSTDISKSVEFILRCP